MSLVRKAFWPAAIALGFLVFLGAIGSGGARTAYADDADICEIGGPKVIKEGGTYLYWVRLDADADDGDPDEVFDVSYEVSIDNVVGKSLITSVVDDDGDEYDQLSPGATTVNDVEPVDDFDIDDDVLDQLLAIDKNFKVEINKCGTSTSAALRAMILEGIDQGSTTADFGDFDIDCPTGATCSIASTVVSGVVSELTAALNADASLPDDCDELGDIAEDAALAAGAPESVGAQFNDFVDDVCDNEFKIPDLGDSFWFVDGVVIVDVTCVEAGEFTISFSDEDENDDVASLDVVCQAAPDNAEIFARPATVEIVPALGNVSHSLIWLQLTADGEMAAPGSEVDFTTDRCSIETAGVDDATEWGAAQALFNAFNSSANPTSADGVEKSTAANVAVDSTRQADTTVSFANSAGNATIAAAILGCNPVDAPGATPGVATVTAVIEVENGQDIVKTVKVTVVGPPAEITVAASPTTLRCGEKSTITVTVKDSIGQNVSDHTKVEAVTNAGGVLGGTGAVAALAGPVVPISSTVAETNAGTAVFYLLTSEQHSGPYEVVVSAGGGGSVASGGVFSTAVKTAQATVTCTIPQAAAPQQPAPQQPQVQAPRTGQGITPPNTGDAGLAESTGSSLIWVIAGAVAFALAGVAGVKFARR